MNEEMKALQKNSTWEVVNLPEGKILVGCRWVFTINTKPMELSNGAKQDSSPRDTLKHMELIIWRFAPVAKINIVRILLSLAVNLD